MLGMLISLDLALLDTTQGRFIPSDENWPIWRVTETKCLCWRAFELAPGAEHTRWALVRSAAELLSAAASVDDLHTAPYVNQSQTIPHSPRHTRLSGPNDMWLFLVNRGSAYPYP